MKKAVILLADGFEEIEALTVVDVLRRAGIECCMCSMDKIMVSGSHKIEVKADMLFENADFSQYDILILPGGMPGAANLRDNLRVVELVRVFHDEKKIIAAICAAPIVLERAGIIKGCCITSHPTVESQLCGCTYRDEIVAEDNNIITSRGPATSIYFALRIVEKLGLSDKAAELKKGMMLEFVENKIKG